MLEKKDLLGLKEISSEDIIQILDEAKKMKQIVLSNNKKGPHLQGKSIITLFYENSTRTRTSFELASKYLGAASANISASSSSVAKGESLLDTAKTLNMMGVDIIIMRHNMSGAPHLIAKNVTSSVINAGDGMNEHPTQALLDMFTMREKLGDIKGKRIAIIGDILHSRVVRSNIYGLTKLGAEVHVAGPATLMPPKIDQLGASVYSSVEDAIRDVDAVMGLRIQLERQKKGLFPSEREYAKFFGLNDEKLALAKDGAFVMHPGPVNRGLDIMSSIIDSDASVINEQVLNGVSIRMALLFLLTRRSKNELNNQ